MQDHGFASVRVARELLERLGRLGVRVDAHFVRLGVVFHDAGKILHPDELTEPGHAHEPAGEQLLLREGVPPALARCCVSHAEWESEGSSAEELLVALSDKLWKGKREPALEKKVVEHVATLLGRSFWDVFVDLDTCFESVAAGGAARLARSTDRADLVL